MPKGIILKGIGGFYYVKTDNRIIECKARGIFRKDNTIPIVGDNVEVSISKHDKLKGNIEKILPRSTYMIRPAVANVQQLIIVTAISSPVPNLMLLDKLLVLAESKKLDIIICFNKIDLSDKESYYPMLNIYKNAGYKVVPMSCHTGEGIDKIILELKGKITAFAGASGVGKSSLINAINPKFKLQTGKLSKKIERGKHTTRHVELLEMEDGGYLVDTPGFTTIEITKEINADELSYMFREFRAYYNMCKFRGCTHTHEPECKIIEAVKENTISDLRYRNYLQIYEQLKEVKEWEK